MARVLIIDDNDTLREGMAVTLKKHGHDIAAFRSANEGITACARGGFDLVITDLRMEPIDGLEVVRQVRARDAGAVVLVVTAYGTIEMAVAAMQLGAYDFITKPFPPEVLRVKVDKALELAGTQKTLHRLMAQNEVLLHDAAAAAGTLVGASEVMQKLLALIKRAAASDATVLVRGESGTGKELVARMIHELSPRKGKPFIPVHCASLAETLLESELFGHERGSFTGATRRKLGRFELADGGTLFLDEIGEVSPAIQTKLLRVLQEKEIQRVGGEQTVKVDVRVISATHRDLKAELAAGRFREDLYYRLHIVPLQVPSLRERPADIAVLARHFVAKHGPKINPTVRGLTDEALTALARHTWPGNVRELENVIEQALVFAEAATLQESDLPPPLQSPTVRAARDAGVLPVPTGDRALPDILEDLERGLIARAYEKAGRVKTETARLLGIKTSALYYKLEKYGFIEKNERDDGAGTPT